MSQIHQCVQCGFSTDHLLLLKRHMTNLHKRSDPAAFVCDLCNQSFRLLKYLRIHMERHMGIKRSHCPDCSAKFVTWSELNQHLKSKHHRNRQTCKLFSCKHCNYQTIRGACLRRHEKRHSAVTLECDLCSYETRSVICFEKHKNKHLQPVWECCHIKFKNYYLKEHKKAHTGGLRRFDCDSCQRKFNCKKDIWRHIKNMHFPSSKPLQCVCGFEAWNKYAFKEHKKSAHTGLKPYSCKFCVYRTSKLFNLQEHLLTHSTDKTKHCDQCIQVFKTTKQLRKHQKQHLSSLSFLPLRRNLI